MSEPRLVCDIWTNDATGDVFPMFRLAHQPLSTLRDVVDKYEISHESRAHQNLVLSLTSAEVPEISSFAEESPCL